MKSFHVVSTVNKSTKLNDDYFVIEYSELYLPICEHVTTLSSQEIAITVYDTFPYKITSFLMY